MTAIKEQEKESKLEIMSHLTESESCSVVPDSLRSHGPWNSLGQNTEYWAFLIAQLVKNTPALQESPVRFLGQEDLLEKG